MSCQCRCGTDQKSGIDDLAAPVHVSDQGDGRDNADASQKKSCHTGTVHAGLFAQPCKRYLQKTLKELCHGKASQHDDTDRRHRFHRFAEGCHRKRNAHLRHIDKRPEDQTKRRQKADGIGKMQKAAHQLFRPSGNTEGQGKAGQKHRQTLTDGI